MELNCSVSAQAGVGHDEVRFVEAVSKGKQSEGRRNEATSKPSRRFLFVHERCGEFGGAEANIHLAAEELRRRGHSIALLYAQGTGRNEENWRQVFDQSFRIRQADSQVEVQHAIQRFEPDLIYLHHLSDLAVFDAILGSQKPVVRMIHDHSLTCLRTYKYNYFTRQICRRPASLYCTFPCLGSLARNPDGLLPVKWASYTQRQKDMQLTKRCDRLLVYSDYQRQELARNGFDPSRIDICVPVRSTNDRQNVSSFGPENVLLFVGQIIRGKGVDVLLAALRKVKTHFRCNIVGTGNHQAHCERLCGRLGLNSRVRFHGYVPPDRLEPFYLEASAFVMSSLWPEPFGMAGPEAMRYGLPVIAFDAGGIQEWLKDGQNGFLVPWRDTDAFAARIEELLQYKELARRMGQHAQDSVTQYDPVRQITSLEKLFEDLIHQTKAPIGL